MALTALTDHRCYWQITGLSDKAAGIATSVFVLSTLEKISFSAKIVLFAPSKTVLPRAHKREKKTKHIQGASEEE